MAGFITNYIQNTAASMLTTGITVAGNMAGNAVGGVGTLIENGGRSVGDGVLVPQIAHALEQLLICHSGVAGGVKSVGDYINSYGDRAVGATASSGGATAVKKTAAKPTAPAAKKALPASAAKALPTSSAPKALPSVGGKPKALPAAPSSAVQGNKRMVSAASRPKPAGTTLPSASRLPPSVKPAVSKPTVTRPPVPTGLSKVAPTSLPKAAPTSLPNGKIRMSAESRPKPAGVAKTVVKR